MTKHKERVTILIWLSVTAGIRILFFLLNYTGVEDTYGFFDSGVLRLSGGDGVLSSGLAFAYTNALSRLIRVVGSNILAVFVWQLVLEIIALFLIVLAVRNLWGIYTSMVTGCLLSASPILLLYLKICSPEEYFLFYYSIIFYILSTFYAQSRRKSWFRSTLGELSMIFMGYYVGVLCIWNYFGFTALFAMILIVIKNYRIFKDKSHLLLMTDGEELEEKDQIMNVFVQLLMLVIGAVLGGFLTLIKYTGESGYTIEGQFNWWYKQLFTLPERTMDFDTMLALYLVFSVIIGAIGGDIIHSTKRKKKTSDAFIKEVEEVKGNLNEFDLDDEPAFFVTDDGRKVSYLENPLPVPKKHEHKEMEFKSDEEESKSVKFDIMKLLKENKAAVIYDENEDTGARKQYKSMLDDMDEEAFKTRFEAAKKAREKEARPVMPQIGAALLQSGDLDDFEDAELEFDFDINTENDDFDME